jgi:hypothetical protein
MLTLLASNSHGLKIYDLVAPCGRRVMFAKKLPWKLQKGASGKHLQKAGSACDKVTVVGKQPRPVATVPVVVAVQWPGLREYRTLRLVARRRGPGRPCLRVSQALVAREQPGDSEQPPANSRRRRGLCECRNTDQLMSGTSPMSQAFTRNQPTFASFH